MFYRENSLLDYVLIDRSLRRQTTLYQEANILYVFEDGKPVWRARDSRDLLHLRDVDIWALVEGDLIRGQLHPGEIQANREWRKQCMGTIYYMETWTWDELFLVGCMLRSVQRAGSLDANRSPVAAIFLSQSISPQSASSMLSPISVTLLAPSSELRGGLLMLWRPPETSTNLWRTFPLCIKPS
jgi:hypothetical protein